MAEEHIQVEYDPNYQGGGYSGVGDFIYLSIEDIDNVIVKHALKHDCEEAIRILFAEKTGLQKHNIIHYTSDTYYDKDGEEIDV